MMLVLGPGVAFPTPPDAYFWPLRDQRISAVRRPINASRSFTSKRIIILLSAPKREAQAYPGLSLRSSSASPGTAHPPFAENSLSYYAWRARQTNRGAAEDGEENAEKTKAKPESAERAKIAEQIV